MTATFLAAGLVCLVAAVIGGGLTALGWQIPGIKSIKRQVVLGLLGMALIGVALKTSSPAPQPSPTSGLAGYWSGTPHGIPYLMVLHLQDQGGGITGTMQSPCQSQIAYPIDLGTIDAHRLVIVISQLGIDPKGTPMPPVKLDLALKNDLLEGSFSQGPFDRQVSLHRGEDTCPNTSK